MTSAGLQLQKALLQALKADAGLNEWVNRRNSSSASAMTG
nr:MAG TPA: hypothetical protein [Caudoviricetes sp.]